MKSKIKSEVNTVDGTSRVSLLITGFGRVTFELDKFPHHCGATIIHNFNVYKANTSKKTYLEVAQLITEWLLNNKQEDINFRRSRIISADRVDGPLALLAQSSKKWKSSNQVTNKQTNRNIVFYWLDRNN